jgi:hypothetical protein
MRIVSCKLLILLKLFGLISHHNPETLAYTGCIDRHLGIMGSFVLTARRRLRLASTQAAPQYLVL